MSALAKYPWQVEVVRGSDLERRVWLFRATAFPKFVLARYCAQARPSRRHKWRPSGEVYAEGSGAGLPALPPGDVVEEARVELASRLYFVVRDCGT